MRPALLIRLQAAGPWRYGPGDGVHDRVDDLYRSDRLFSALTLAMQRLGYLDDWLEATVRSAAATVALGSLFPYQGDTLFAIPPATLWPPPSAQVTAPNAVFLSKIRWKTASFVPLTVIDTLATGGGILADQWLPDPASACLLRRDRLSASPFRVILRSFAAVDRLAHAVNSAASSACVEFEPGAGLWTAIRYRDASAESAWNERVRAAFRLLADSGFGGRRTSGWGQAHAPQFQEGAWPSLILPKVGRLNGSGSGVAEGAREKSRFWLLSLYSPSPSDGIDWRSGEYQITTRAGRVESNSQSGIAKKTARMIAEGSVLVATSEPSGAAVDVAPDGFEHPVYRSGLALAIELPSVLARTAEEIETELRPAEEPATAEALTERPCEEAGKEEPQTAEFEAQGSEHAV